jgi:hypothetical protein
MAKPWVDVDHLFLLFFCSISFLCWARSYPCVPFLV